MHGTTIWNDTKQTIWFKWLFLSISFSSFQQQQKKLNETRKTKLTKVSFVHWALPFIYFLSFRSFWDNFFFISFYLFISGSTIVCVLYNTLWTYFLFSWLFTVRRCATKWIFKQIIVVYWSFFISVDFVLFCDLIEYLMIVLPSHSIFSTAGRQRC